MTQGGRFDGDTETFVTHTLRGEGFDASEDGTGRGTPIIPIDLRQASRGEKFTNNRTNGGPTGIGVGKPGDPAFTVSERGQAVAFQTRIARNGRGQPKDITDALTSSDGGTHADSKPHVAYARGVRRLTPRECERLQGFEDDWTRYNAEGKELADGPRYRMLGNAVNRNVAEYIGRRIVAATPQ